MIYMREWNGGLLAGGFETVAKPVFHRGIPQKFEFQLLTEDWDHFRKNKLINIFTLIDFFFFFGDWVQSVKRSIFFFITVCQIAAI